MKIQLDYDNKKISLEDSTKLDVFIETIQKILPDWKDWVLETQTTIYWNNPVVSPQPWITSPQPIQPIYMEPWWERWVITCDTNQHESVDYTVKKTPTTGIVQFEVN